MSNIAVVYASRTRHSKKLAAAIGEGLGVTPLKASEALRLEGLDLLFLVGGIYGGTCHPALLELAGRLSPQQVAKSALVTSSTSQAHGQKDVQALLEKQSIPVLEEYMCYGNFFWMQKGHPNQEELTAAAAFAKKLANQIETKQ